MAHPATMGIAARIAVVNGQVTTTTQDIADVYGKDHGNVLKIVRKRMAEAGEWGIVNFNDTPYTNPQNGQTYTVIRMTKKGFHFVVGKFTGAKAVQHQIAYADEFDRMEAELAGRPQSALPQHSSADLVDMLGLASSIARLVEQQLFTTLVQQHALPMGNLPASVRPMVYQKAAEMAAQALPHITHWLGNQVSWGFDTTTPQGRDKVAQYATNRLNGYSYESWLSEGKADMARSMAALFATMKGMATENEAAVLAQLANLRQVQASREQATTARPPANTPSLFAGA